MENQINQTIGQRFRQLREKADLTQEEFGKLFGVKKATVSLWETGKVTNIKRATLMVIADRLNVNPLWIMGMDVPMEKRTPSEDAIQGEIEKRLAWMNGKQLGKVLRFIEEFL